jgi:hypothetical protein
MPEGTVPAGDCPQPPVRCSIEVVPFPDAFVVTLYVLVCLAVVAVVGLMVRASRRSVGARELDT